MHFAGPVTLSDEESLLILGVFVFTVLIFISILTVFYKSIAKSIRTDSGLKQKSKTTNSVRKFISINLPVITVISFVCLLLAITATAQELYIPSDHGGFSISGLLAKITVFLFFASLLSAFYNLAKK